VDCYGTKGEPHLDPERLVRIEAKCGLQLNEPKPHILPRSTGANSLCVIAPWEISRHDSNEAGGMINWWRRGCYGAVVWSWYWKGRFEARYLDQMYKSF
jgi:hypothetical protein